MGLDVDFYHKHNGKIEHQLYLRRPFIIHEWVLKTINPDDPVYLYGYQHIKIPIRIMYELKHKCKEYLRDVEGQRLLQYLINSQDDYPDAYKDYTVLSLYMFLNEVLGYRNKGHTYEYEYCG